MDTDKPDNLNPLAEQDFGLAVCVLASGSRGNAIYITDGTTAILVDAGPSGVICPKCESSEVERQVSGFATSGQVADAGPSCGSGGFT